LLAAAYVGRDPASYTEAMRSEDSDQWSEACQYEMDALAKNGTWELVDLPPSRRAVKSKWVFKLKVDGRYRAWLVAKRFTQIPGLDFDETFSPVTRFELLRLLLALAALEDWHIYQMDVKSAFLNGELDRRFTWSSHRVSSPLARKHRCVTLKKRYVVSNKPPANGICNSMESFLDSATSGQVPMQAFMYVINKRGIYLS
jgi:hypothetical protein